MAAYALIMLGSALGGLARYWISLAMTERLGPAFPWGTLTVNVTGAVLIGLAVGLAGAGEPAGLDPVVAQFAVLGFLGSYTTVSSFSLQTMALAREQGWRAALANIALSVGLCLLGAWGGYGLGAAISGGVS